MELKRDYFPTMKAPDIAKKKVMQYIYENKKNLTRRFYFYRIYAPAFLLLFIIWWWLTFYSRELKPNKNIYTVVNDYWKTEFAMQDGDTTTAMNQNTTPLENYSRIQVPVQETNELDTLAQRQISNPDAWLLATQTLTNTTADNITNDSNVMMAKSLMISESSPIVAEDEPWLNQQISELESLMNDISSITSQEEILF